MTPDGKRMTVGLPVELFDVNPPVLEAIYWTVAADGEMFLTVNTQRVSAPKFCNLVLDWPGVLEKR
jgi:hypothetical protein